MSTRKRSVPSVRCFIWSRQEHKRFTLAVEKLVSTVNDLGVVAVQLQRQIDQLRAAVASQAAAVAEKGGGA